MPARRSACLVLVQPHVALLRIELSLNAPPGASHVCQGLQGGILRSVGKVVAGFVAVQVPAANGQVDFAGLRLLVGRTLRATVYTLGSCSWARRLHQRPGRTGRRPRSIWPTSQNGRSRFRSALRPGPLTRARLTRRPTRAACRRDWCTGPGTSDNRRAGTRVPPARPVATPPPGVICRRKMSWLVGPRSTACGAGRRNK